MRNRNARELAAPGPNTPKSLVWRKNASGTDVCHWSDVDSAVIRGAVDAVARAGGAIMFGVTSDGGCFSVCLLHNAEKIKEYPHNAEEVSDLLEEIIRHYSNALA
jgi:hypothetical protein